jgi:phage virion morphogenesis protein
MAGAAIEVKVEDKEVKLLLAGIQSRLGYLTPVMKIIGQTVRTSVVRNFEKEGRPEKWEPLAKSTLKQKLSNKILREKGFFGGLQGSISARAEKDRAVVGTNKIYAAIHQFGGKAGRGLKVTIPARPFLMVQNEDWSEIRAALSDYIANGRVK